MIRWIVLGLAVIFLIVVSSALLNEMMAERFAAQAMYVVAAGRADAMRIEAGANARVAVMMAALPYFLVLAGFLGFCFVSLLVARFMIPGHRTTNNYILEVSGEQVEQSRTHIAFDRLNGRVLLADRAGGPARGAAALQHRRPVHDQDYIVYAEE